MGLLDGERLAWSGFTNEVFYLALIRHSLRAVSTITGLDRNAANGAAAFDLSGDGRRAVYLTLQSFISGDLHGLDLATNSSRVLDHNATLFAMCPDGNKVASTHYTDGCDSIFTIPFTGGAPLYRDCGVVLSMSPDCGSFLFRRANVLWIATDSAPPLQVVAPVDSTASILGSRWITDEAVAVLFRATPGSQVLLFTSSTGGVVDVMPGNTDSIIAGSVAWSHDGSLIALVTNRHEELPTPGQFSRSASVWLYDIVGNTLRRVATSPNYSVGNGLLPVATDVVTFGPDDRSLAFVVNRTLYMKSL